MPYTISWNNDFGGIGCSNIVVSSSILMILSTLALIIKGIDTELFVEEIIPFVVFGALAFIIYAGFVRLIYKIFRYKIFRVFFYISEYMLVLGLVLFLIYMIQAQIDYYIFFQSQCACYGFLMGVDIGIRSALKKLDLI